MKPPKGLLHQTHKQPLRSWCCLRYHPRFSQIPWKLPYLDWFLRDFSAAYAGDLSARRGGSWHDNAENCTSSSSEPVDASVPVFDAGFRVALKPLADIPKNNPVYAKTPLHPDTITGLAVLIKFPDDPDDLIIPKEKVEYFLN